MSKNQRAEKICPKVNGQIIKRSKIFMDNFRNKTENNKVENRPKKTTDVASGLSCVRALFGAIGGLFYPSLYYCTTIY